MPRQRSGAPLNARFAPPAPACWAFGGNAMRVATAAATLPVPPPKGPLAARSGADHSFQP
eukprot:357606-Chlamydomonas_euryale.AAC.6